MEKSAEPEFDCCDDDHSVGRRLLWWKKPCLCCGNNKFQAQRHLLAMNFAQFRSLAEAGGTDVDVDVKTKNKKQANLLTHELTQDKINHELNAAGLPSGEVTKKPEVHSTQPPAMSPYWPHHDKEIWKEVRNVGGE